MNAQALVLSSVSARITAFLGASLLSLCVLTGIDTLAARDYAAAVAAHSGSSSTWQVAETQTVVVTAKRLSSI
ncbi:hypothetical protein [Ideonella paludis]|uniref:Uncharacterized protein n=1 Tax=Ideonella paludis TaxID=1233411 RepID=A0ABS5DY69_9BURK|nr:hypothetical protein [Ideonella paludis]MBQ0936095.1 hypothetical protein [Ideonella paludis]